MAWDRRDRKVTGVLTKRGLRGPLGGTPLGCLGMRPSTAPEKVQGELCVQGGWAFISSSSPMRSPTCVAMEGEIVLGVGVIRVHTEEQLDGAAMTTVAVLGCLIGLSTSSLSSTRWAFRSTVRQPRQRRRRWQWRWRRRRIWRCGSSVGEGTFGHQGQPRLASLVPCGIGIGGGGAVGGGGDHRGRGGGYGPCCSCRR